MSQYGNIEDVDQITSSIVRALCEAAPTTNWVIARMIARFSPTGAGRFAYEYLDENGIVDSMTNPDPSKTDELFLLTMKHFRLTRQTSRKPWFSMRVDVHRNGQFNVDFDFRESYVEGDIFRA